MIKVLYVLTKPELGGAQKHVLSLLVGLDKSRFDLNLFTASKGYLIDRFCDIPGVHVHKSSFLKRDLSLFNDIPALFELYFYIRKNKFDVVHTHSSKAGILGRMAAWLAGVRCVVHTVHGWSFNAYQHKFVYLAYVFLERLCARCTHVLVVVSSIERTQGVALKIIPLGEYVLIHCGIRHEDYRHTDDQKIDLRQQLGIDPGCCVVGTVACLKPQKDPFAFLKLAVELKKEITGIKFLLVGDGLLREKIISFLHDNDLDNDVILTGWREDIPSLLSIMNVFVLTSLWEGLPVVILEAMAAGVAVVATDTGGVVDVIIPGLNGDLVKPGDIKSMSVKIVVLLRDHKIRNCYIKQARLRVNEKEFSIDEAVGCVQAVYENGLQRMKA